MLVGCSGGSPDQSAPNATNSAPVQLDDPAKQALLPQMSGVARTAPTGWSSLTAEQKAPFLQFHANDEAKAKQHYEGLVETERDIQKNLGQ